MATQTTIPLRLEIAPQYHERLRTAFPQVDFPLCPTPEAFAPYLTQADALIGGAPLSPAELAQAARLRWIQVPFAGVDRFLTPELRAQGITVTNFSGVHVPNIPEHVLAMMFSFARQLRYLGHQQDNHRWRDRDDSGGPGPGRDAFRGRTFEIEGQTLGVVGMGDIGAGLARKAHALGMRVLATKRTPTDPPPYVDRLLTNDGLPALLAESDHVALCLPLTAATRHVIGAAELAQMKPTAYVYNIGRGELIDQEALIAALRAGTIAGAGLDVTTPEPLPADSPLWAMPNVLVTGHTSGATPKYWERGTTLVIENVRRFLAGEPLVNVVDADAGY